MAEPFPPCVARIAQYFQRDHRRNNEEWYATEIPFPQKRGNPHIEADLADHPVVCGTARAEITAVESTLAGKQ